MGFLGGRKTSPSVRRAVALERSRHTAKAVQAIYNSGLVDIASSSAAQEDMERLHPSGPPDLPPLPPNSPFFAVKGDDHFIKIWKQKVANGSAAGPTQFSGDHGLPLLEDPDCTRGLAVIVQRICNERFDVRFKQLLLSCLLIEAPKKDLSTRPIAIEETLYKMAAHLILHSLKGEVIESPSLLSYQGARRRRLWRSKLFWRRTRDTNLTSSTPTIRSTEM